MGKGDYFSHLKQVVANMKPHEIKVAQKFIVAFYSTNSRNSNKSLKLFRLIHKKPDISLEEAKQLVSKTSNKASFRRLVVRLCEKLMEVIVLDHTIHKQGTFSKSLLTRMEIQKKINQSIIFRTRGLSELSYDYLEQVIEKAKMYELYDELVTALVFKQQLEGLSKGGKAFYRYNEDIDFFNRCRQAFNNAENWYYRHFLEVDASGLNNDKLGLLTEAIAELEEEYEYTNSARVGFFLYTLKMEYFLVVEEYQISCETGIKLAKLIQENPSIYSKGKLGITYSNLSDNELFVHDFESSIEHSKLGQKLFGLKGFNFEVTKEVEFRAHYYNGDSEQAYRVISELLEITDPKANSFHYSKRAYLKACVLFLQGEYRKSYFLLQETKEIEKDKEGWNIGIRVLSIMCHVEMTLLDLADSEIESMRKHIQRLKGHGNLRRRDQTILTILLRLEKHSFNFKVVYEQYQELFELLKSPEKDLRWEVKTPEMIIFPDWFMAKMNDKPYEFQIPGLPETVKEKAKVKK